MGKKLDNREKKIIMIFLGIIFFTILAWALVQPFNASPDEIMRYQIVEYIIKHGKLPAGYDPEIRDPNWGISYAFNPITTYIVGAVFGKIATLFSSASMAPVYGARIANVCIGTFTAWINLKIGKLLFEEKRMAWMYTILVCFLPGVIFASSYVNMDGLGLCASSWIVLCWCKALKQKNWSVKLCIEFGAAISLCALSYYNSYGYILCSIFFFCLSNLYCGENRGDVKKMIQLGLCVTAVVALLAGWWFIRNAVLYDGDFLGRAASAKYAEMYAAEGYTNETRTIPKRMGMSVWGMYVWIPTGWNYNWLGTVAVSFIGTFGFMTNFLPKAWYKIYLVLFGVGIVATVPCWREMLAIRKGKKKVIKKEKDEDTITTYLEVRTERRWSMMALFHICMFAAMVIPFILLTIYSYTSDFQAQGRYVLPMVIPFMYLVTRGFEFLMKWFVSNEKVQEWIVRILCGAYILSAYLVYFIIFLPTYR